jgi:MscS family membrane protein
MIISNVVVRLPHLVLLIALIVVWSPAKTADLNPLRPIDTSSPRATFQGFVETIDGMYLHFAELVNSYSISGRLYLSHEEHQTQRASLLTALSAERFLDTSRIPPVLLSTVAAERAIQLKEILDRIEIPPLDQIPDHDAITGASTKRWRLPNTEIDIVLIQDGSRAGEFLVSADTVDRLPEFYDRVRNLPYKPGPAKDLASAYRAISSDQTATIFDAFTSSPVGLSMIVPPRWMLRLPTWAKTRVAELTVWQWIGFALGLSVGTLLVFGVYRLTRRHIRDQEADSGIGLYSLLTPLVIIVATELYLPLLTTVLRIGGPPRVVTEFARVIAFFASTAWLVLIGFGILGRAIVSSERLSLHSLDSQLIKLGTRFIGVVFAIGLVMQAATELGFPAYSVLAGLGVGGLAVALAARDSLANLLGSILIMFEQPFRIGHQIRVAGSEGTVEDVGFRSTRLRTADNSVISIPNNAVVNASVENLSLRQTRRQRLLLQIDSDTSPEKIETFCRSITQLISDNPFTKKDNIYVRFNDFGESSLNILASFHFEVANYAAELEERERILLRVIELAKTMDVDFASPTEIVRVETMSPAGLSGSAARHASSTTERPKLLPAETALDQS